MSANEPKNANEIWMKRIEFRNPSVEGRVRKGSANGGFAEVVDSDEQSSAKHSDEKKIHFEEDVHLAGEAGFEKGGGGVFRIIKDGNAFSDGIGVDDALGGRLRGEMNIFEGTPGAEVFGGSHLIAILNFWAVALRLFKAAGDKARQGDDTLGLGPLGTVPGAVIAGKRGGWCKSSEREEEQNDAARRERT